MCFCVRRLPRGCAACRGAAQVRLEAAPAGFMTVEQPLQILFFTLMCIFRLRIFCLLSQDTGWFGTHARANGSLSLL